jgi:hypothetical protein
MKLFILLDLGDAGSYGEEMSIEAFQSKELLYRSIVDQLEDFGDPEVIESANLYFEKGDYEDILDLYEDECDVRLQVFERTLKK